MPEDLTIWGLNSSNQLHCKEPLTSYEKNKLQKSKPKCLTVNIVMTLLVHLNSATIWNIEHADTTFYNCAAEISEWGSFCLTTDKIVYSLPSQSSCFRVTGEE